MSHLFTSAGQSFGLFMRRTGLQDAFGGCALDTFRLKLCSFTMFVSVSNLVRCTVYVIRDPPGPMCTWQQRKV